MDARGYMPVSKTTEYETPHDLFDRLDAEFGPFTLDPCGQREHNSASRIVGNGGHFYDGSTEAMDGLLQPWDGRVFMNPPYGKEIAKWVEKSVQEVYVEERAEIVVALLPVRTDTAWWQGYVNRGNAMTQALADKLLRITLARRKVRPHYATVTGTRYLPGRVTFHGMKASAPFPSAVVVWRNDA